jgi:REP element-mobilizing transposase RayT
MANSYTSLHYHIVFSTRNREPWLVTDIDSVYGHSLEVSRVPIG